DVGRFQGVSCGFLLSKCAERTLDGSYVLTAYVKPLTGCAFERKRRFSDLWCKRSRVICAVPEQDLLVTVFEFSLEVPRNVSVERIMFNDHERSSSFQLLKVCRKLLKALGTGNELLCPNAV